MKILNMIDGARFVIQDSDNRFVTDSEKIAWENKANSEHTHSVDDITGIDFSKIVYFQQFEDWG